MSAAAQAKWAARYQGDGPWPAPCAVLADNLHLLPPRGAALDLACGLGANALLLARRGLTVSAWDFAPPAIARLRAAAAGQGVTLRAEVRDVLRWPPPPRGFAVIVVCRFLERGLAPALAQALEPGGLLFYQTFTRSSPGGPRNPAYRLAPDELPRLFGDLRPLFYRENGPGGEAQLIGQKPEA